ncbi:MAG: hypothetical protein Q7U89_05460, partial [Coriobacteriia bacterium]|nr:hypothetical protein [Coriobacteriia bacterium]
TLARWKSQQDARSAIEPIQRGFLDALCERDSRSRSLSELVEMLKTPQGLPMAALLRCDWL